MPSHHIFAGLFLVALFLFRMKFRRPRKDAIINLPGPPQGSWLVGDIPELLRPINVGDADFAWTKTYGSSLRIKGVFGRDLLFTTDPKCFQYILSTSCYSFPKFPQFKFIVALFAGRGIAWAEGAHHVRHRKAMDPAFSNSAIKHCVPLFRQTVQQTVGKWRDIITEAGNLSSSIDIVPWMGRTALDMIGSAAFDYHFGALEEKTNNELYQAYSNLFVDAFLQRSDLTFAFEELCGILPDWLLTIMLSIVPDKMITKVQNYMRIARRVARSLVDQRINSYEKGEDSGNDILSLLVKSNLSLAPTNQMTYEETLAQLTTLTVAGHETTAATMSWVLYELSMSPEVQTEIRQEIKATRVRVARRGDAEFSAGDLDSMKLLGAVLKETLRYHPVLPQLMRVADRDDVIPLSKPQRTDTGEYITGISVRKGQGIVMSVAAFNRHKDVWGDDADIWRPQRFQEEVEGKPKTGLGVFANILTFSAGTRSCIGWRFAMVEMQVMLVELIENFEFAPPPGDIQILRAATTTMNPMVKGSKDGRSELPLTVTPIV